MYYHELSNLKENRKRKTIQEICNTCYRRFYPILGERSKPVENQVANDDTTKPLIKKSSIGGNGKLLPFSESGVLIIIIYN